MNMKPKPLMGEWSRQRLSIGLPAFTNTGIDYIWPLPIKLNKQEKPVQHVLQSRHSV